MLIENIRYSEYPVIYKFLNIVYINTFPIPPPLLLPRMKTENKTVNENSKSRIDFDCYLEVNHERGYYCSDTKIHRTITA